MNFFKLSRHSIPEKTSVFSSSTVLLFLNNMVVSSHFCILDNESSHISRYFRLRKTKCLIVTSCRGLQKKSCFIGVSQQYKIQYSRTQMSQAGRISLTSQSLNHIYLPTPTETQSMNKNAQDKYLGCNSATKSQESYIYLRSSLSPFCQNYAFNGIL